MSSPPIHDSPILVVDDAEYDRRLVAEILRKSGFTRVDAVADGVEALDRLRRAPPDLLLLDLKMPAPDGFAVLAAIRADERLSRLPVLVLTALVAPEERNRALESGATDLVVKPVEPVELVARVRIQLEYRALAMALQSGLERRKAELDLARELAPALQPDPGPALARVEGMGAVVRLRPGSESMLAGEAWGLLPAGEGIAAYRLLSKDGVMGALALHRMAEETLVGVVRAGAADPGAWLGRLGAAVPRLLGPGAVVVGTCASLAPAGSGGALRLSWAAAGRAGAWSGCGGVPPAGPPLGGRAAYRAAGLDLPPGGLAALGPVALAPGPASALLAAGDAGAALDGLAGMVGRSLGEPLAGRTSVLVLGRAA